MRHLFEGGVYSRAAFIRGNTVVANPIIYRLVPSPSRYEIRQWVIKDNRLKLARKTKGNRSPRERGKYNHLAAVARGSLSIKRVASNSPLI